jgi:hypothetical protein
VEQVLPEAVDTKTSLTLTEAETEESRMRSKMKPHVEISTESLFEPSDEFLGGCRNSLAGVAVS